MYNQHCKNTILAAAAALAALPGIMSCSDDTTESAYAPKTYNYTTYVFGASDNHQIVLDSLTSAISSVESDASWLSARIDDDAGGAHPAVRLTSRRTGSETGNRAVVTVKGANGDLALIAVHHSEMSMGDAQSGANDEFMRSWWTYTSIPLQGIASAQRAPWDIEGGANIPNAIRKQYTPTLGWEMAFCYLTDDTMEGVRFFALYNKWTGQMRVYTYIADPTSWGNEVAFRTYFGEEDSNDLYPLYNVFQYGIPSNRIPGVNMLRNAQLVKGQPQTFCTWLSPYMNSSSLSPGWYVFEFDMSGYVPKGKDWLKENVNEAKFKFFAETKNNQQLTLKGSLVGKLSGTFQNERIVQNGGTNALYGISNTLNMLSGMATSSIGASSSYALLMNNGGAEGLSGKFNPIRYWGGFVCGMGGAYLGYLASEIDPITYDTIPGKIDLALDATIDLEGYISNYTTNGFKPLAVSPKAIATANGSGGHVGKGVWGLADDPVVYIDKDVLMCNEDHIRFVNRGNGVYSQTEFDSYAMRLVWFFDPQSVKVNINRDLFPDVKKVCVTTTCAVYPNKAVGHTDAYRAMLMLKERPHFDISQGKAAGKLVTLDGKSSPRLIVVTANDLLATGSDAYETKANTGVVAYPGSDWRYHGRLIKEGGKEIVVEPQVYLPYRNEGGTFLFNDPTAPDFIVTVNVAFESQGSTFHYSKCFIPRIELIDHASTKTRYQALREYAVKCKAEKPTGTLANDASVPVVNIVGHALVEKTLRMLELTCK